MFCHFFDDDRGAMLAEYALLMVIACGCLAILAFKLGNEVSAAFRHAAEILKNEVTMIAENRTIELKP